MTLEELVKELLAAQEMQTEDMPVRFVVKREGMDQARMHDCIDVRVTEGWHGQITLILAGAVVAECDWPPT